MTDFVWDATFSCGHEMTIIKFVEGPPDSTQLCREHQPPKVVEVLELDGPRVEEDA